MDSQPLLKGDILIVDDKPENLRVLSAMLSEQGYKVRAAISGAVALRAAQATPPDLVLLDILMPEMDGYEVCRRLKQVEATNPVPVIFLSALDETLDKVKAFEAGGLDYITKPFRLEEVLARIQTQLNLRLAQVEIRQLNLELEARVQQRTAQLEAANQQLMAEIQERQQVEAQLRQLVLHDRLTGLPNRAFFLQRMQALLDRAESDQPFALLFLDCDGFKVVNDSLGHLVGDQLLIAIARRLEACLAPGQMLIRLGGDEFLCLMETVASVETATDLANQILEAYTTPFWVEQQEMFLNVSIGIVTGGANYQQPEHVLRDADIAMYRAKGLGKGMYQVFSPEMYTQALARLQLDNALRQAVDRQELLLYYQPIVAIATGQIVGFEALLRWQHPDNGMISPAQFIPIAEETGLIIPIGQWVLQTACKQLRTWQQIQPSLHLSVNLSIKQLSHPRFLAEIDRLPLDQIHPGSLTLELTESMMMQNVEPAIATLNQLRARSLRLSIDDFGQGYSSLSYLHDFPVDLIKIDRAFISGTDQNPRQEIARMEIVKTIIDLAHNLGVSVVAEGVETEAQRDRLCQLGCEFGQGYFFSRPVDADTGTAMITATKPENYFPALT
jgi:diguanylate cyclase (GGDEF)-like protein